MIEPDDPQPGRGFHVLRYRDFRLFWIGAIISFLGLWMEHVARNWLIYAMTGSALSVGLNGLFMTIPFVVTSLYAGTLVDRIDRRRLLLWIETLTLASFVVLTILIAAGWVQVWHIYATSAFQALLGAFESPARSSLLPHLVPRGELVGAVNLFSVNRRGTQIIGPALGGIAVAALGVEGTYIITCATYALLPGALFLMRTTNPPSPTAERNPVKALAESFRYVRHETLIGTLLLMETFISIFGNYNTMMVVFARDIFEVGAEGLGFLQSAAGAGSVLGSVALAMVGTIRYKGRVMLVAGGAHCLAVTMFAVCPSFLLALPILAAVGAADIVMGTLRVTLIQLAVESSLRGRVMALQAISTRGISGLGGFQTGALAAVVGVQPAVAFGAMIGAAVMLFVAWRVPSVRNFADADTAAAAGVRRRRAE